MITPEEIEQIIERALQGAVVGAVDMTGTADHFEVRVSCESFRGKSLVEQHQMINRALKAPLEDGRIHALKIKTSVPQQ
ncbi:MAG TPA: BolA/IbaG family iron-sulfur metabolism protein [Verrucomicrobiae bacterium]|jgi:stress-induced morphogen|nr:BolA/IbaG family iron-sulfur metabolism protein [Verrucomicrobiae bacterium]